MRKTEVGQVLAVRAIGGLHVVTLAWDFVAGQEAKRDGLMGFAIERTEVGTNGKDVARYYLRGTKRFRHKDEGLAPGTPVPTSEHPAQTFQWGDYTPQPATTYRFKVVPVYGQPKMLTLDDASSTTVTVTTEAEVDAEAADGSPSHDIYFNRGVAGSQAFARKFGDQKLDENAPKSDPMVWLSRGLFEALTGFIGLAAKKKTAKNFALRAMLYEFHYAPVGLAFKEAAAAGADVSIRYEAQSYKDDNETMINHVGIADLCKPQKVRAGIRHNKFIVLLEKEKPIAVWTGSTNISAGGIFGHSNVGHVIWDAEIAQRYLDFWTQLAEPDVATKDLKAANVKVEPTPAPGEAPPEDRILTLFCPRDSKGDDKTLQWFADLIGGANRIACATIAFNLDELLRKALLEDDGTLRYAVFDKNPGKLFEDDVYRIRNTVIAPGAKLQAGDMENFLGEQLTGFNKNLYIHDKFILADPLSKDPIVVTGTANFSKPSQNANDENMLVIRGNTRVADIYFGEFMRIFDHLYSRYIVRKLTDEGKHDPNAGYLKEQSKEWVPANFKAGPKQLRRQFFMAE